MSDIGTPGPDTSPGKAIPLPGPPSFEIPSISTLKSWLPLYFSKTDKAVHHFSLLLKNPSATDRILFLIGYSSLAASNFLTTASLRHFRSRLQNIVKTASNLSPNTTLLVPASQIPSPKLLSLAKTLKATSSMISDFRTFTRLWGLLDIYIWARDVYSNPPEDETLKRIAWAQVVVNIGYQYLENGAYLSGKGILAWDTERQTRAWLWSSRCWAVHVTLELWKLMYLRRKAGDVEVEMEGGWDIWWRQVVVNALYAPMTIHWSLENGLLSDLAVGSLGIPIGLIGVRKFWNATA